MTYFLFKLVLTSLLVVIVSELARRSTVLGAVVASIPLVSVLGMIWLYIDTRDSERIARLSIDILWLTLPSLLFFILLPLLLRRGTDFLLSLGIAAGATVGAYLLMIIALRRL